MLVPFVDQIYNCCVVGKLFHVTHIRFDIAFATGLCTRFVTKPQVLHLKVAFTIFRYLKHIANLCLLYHGGENVMPHGYFDSDYQGNLDERKSTSSYVVSLGTAPTS